MRFVILVAALAALWVQPAAAATITFNPAAGMNTFDQTSFTESGYTITYTPLDESSFAEVYNVHECGPPCTTSGTNNFQSYNKGKLSIVATDGSPFSLTSFDAATTFTTVGRVLDLNLIADTLGGVINQNFSTAPGGADVFSTYYAPISDILSLTFIGGPDYATSEFALDNIILSSVGNAVPEPATWALMILGIGAIGVGLRRRPAIVSASH